MIFNFGYGGMVVILLSEQCKYSSESRGGSVVSWLLLHPRCIKEFHDGMACTRLRPQNKRNILGHCGKETSILLLQYTVSTSGQHGSDVKQLPAQLTITALRM
jgi:hypothetical protein